MENFELYLEPQRNRKTGRFYAGHVPFNRGKKWSEWMPEKYHKKLRKNLELGYGGNKSLPGLNRIEIAGIKEGKLTIFKSATDAAKILKAEGIEVNTSNIRIVCNGKRKKAGGYRWFNAKNIKIFYSENRIKFAFQ